MANNVKVTTDNITEESVREFILTLNYEHESSEFVKDDFPNAAHLITPTTDLVLLNFIIKRQRDGLQLGFIDSEKFKNATALDFETIYGSNVAKLMLPGYAEIYQNDFTGLSPYVNDYLEAQYIVEDIMTHFGRMTEYNLLAGKLYTIEEIVKFINNPIVLREGNSIEVNFDWWGYKAALIFLPFFIIYWIATDLKKGVIAGCVALVAYLAYKSFKQFKKDIGA